MRFLLIAVLGALLGGAPLAWRAEAQEVWAARCLDQGSGTDAEAVHAATRGGLLEACQRIVARPVVHDERRVPCGLGLPGCACAGHLIAPQNGAAVDFDPGTAWELCSGYVLAFQQDGNLVLYNRNKDVLWATWTHGRSVAKLAMQPDGNLVLYGPDGSPVWTSNTHGNPNAFLAVQEDGNVVLYGGRWKVIWATWTRGG